MEQRDVIIVGAGLSGIGAAVHLQRECPGRSFLILEGRTALGGTWDQFRYPGIRSDTDAYSYAYDFKAWRGDGTIAQGAALRDYIGDTAAEHGLDRHIRLGHRVTRASWSTAAARWVLDATSDDGMTSQFTCRLLSMCSGYFSLRAGHAPEIPGRDRYRGQLVHPQDWPEDLDCRGQRVVVIGSGATAMTLVPALARSAAQVVMLQRSPTYVVSIPSRVPFARALRAVLPTRWADAALRRAFIALQQHLYRRARRRPARVRREMIGKVRRELGDACDVDRHFSPGYRPWDQRVCFVPDGDLFAAIRNRRASVVTGRIARLTEGGIELEDGSRLDADVIVTATGLEVVTPGEMAFDVDGAPVDFATTWTYLGRMFSGVPNLVYTFGYVNASWTLRADLTARFTCRLINHLEATGTRQVTPRLRSGDGRMIPRPWIESFTPGYMQRWMQRMPRQGDCEPWVNVQDYNRDRALVSRGLLDDGALVFGNPAPSARPELIENLDRPLKGVVRN